MEQSFENIAAAMMDEEGIMRGRMFGAEGLKIRGKVFAMKVDGELVVKLSPARADAVVQSGEARRFDPGHGRPMKQWVSLPPNASLDWLQLAREARQVVAEA